MTRNVSRTQKMKQKKQIVFFVSTFALLMVLAGGCTQKTRTVAEVQALFNKHRNEGRNQLYYMGSDQKVHYFCHEYLTSLTRRTYRIAKTELSITNEFEITKNNREWRAQEMPFPTPP